MQKQPVTETAALEYRGIVSVERPWKTLLGRSGNRLAQALAKRCRAVRNNAVRDISPLLNGEELLMVDVRRNPLANDALRALDEHGLRQPLAGAILAACEKRNGVTIGD